MACRSCLALPCKDLGSLLSTFAALCTQQRCCLAFGQTSCSACQKPSAPSPVASSGSSTIPFWSRSRAAVRASSGRSLETILDRQQLLPALGVGADEDQDALPIVLEPR